MEVPASNFYRGGFNHVVTINSFKTSDHLTRTIKANYCYLYCGK